MKRIEVVAAVFVDNNKIFCAQKADKGEQALKWEFPGGKIEAGESQQKALIREIKEELVIDIEVRDYIMTVKHQYDDFHITMHAYFCQIINGKMVLKEHLDSCWLKVQELESLDWAEADIPIVKKIKEMM